MNATSDSAARVGKNMRHNLSGIPIDVVYGPGEGDGGRSGKGRKLPAPGEFPFLRGIHPEMYRKRPWTPRLVVGLGTPEDYNRRMTELYQDGLSGLFVSPSNIHLRGYDTDQVPRELVSGIGVLLSTTDDLDRCLEGLPLDKESISLGDTAPYTLSAMLVAVARRRGVPIAKIGGTTNQADYLSHYAALHMFYRIPLDAQKRMLLDHAVWMRKNMPRWNPFSVVGQHVQQAGATPAESMAITLSSAIQYADDLIERGEDIANYIGRFSFFFDVSLSLFEEVAKFRAGRRIWASIVKARFRVDDPKAQRLRFHTQTSGAELTQQEPLNNLVRVTVQALGAIFGGTQSLHTDSYDEALGTPSRLAVQLAVNTQHILREETGIVDVVDPLGGSFYIESLTDEMENRIREVMKVIEAEGGMRAALKGGIVQGMIGNSALRYQEEVEEGRRRVVGVNKYVNPSVYEELDLPAATTRPDAEAVDSYLLRLQEFKDARSDNAVRKALDDLARVLEGANLNAYEAIIKAAEAGATHGEICAQVREVVGFGQPETFV